MKHCDRGMSAEDESSVLQEKKTLEKAIEVLNYRDLRRDVIAW